MNCKRRGSLNGMRTRSSVRLSVRRLCDKAPGCFSVGHKLIASNHCSQRAKQLKYVRMMCGTGEPVPFVQSVFTQPV